MRDNTQKILEEKYKTIVEVVQGMSYQDDPQFAAIKAHQADTMDQYRKADPAGAAEYDIEVATEKYSSPEQVLKDLVLGVIDDQTAINYLRFKFYSPTRGWPSDEAAKQVRGARANPQNFASGSRHPDDPGERIYK